MIHASFCLVSFFSPLGGGDMSLRNIRGLPTDYTALYLRIQNSSKTEMFNLSAHQWNYKEYIGEETMNGCNVKVLQRHVRAEFIA
jgi:hypothetical protein